ncbi:MAG TPA: sensor domain-containing diguanylate cyclase, partial [Polyangiaceae bacterium]|nr:sensor domain-containing diguanylate cyclase [Polyangiaceae bacterium]
HELARVYPELFSRELAVVGDTWRCAGVTDQKVFIAGQEMRSCATAAIHTADGVRVGTLCVMDTQPRVWGPLELESLADLSAQVEQHLELEAVSRRLEAARATQLALDESRARFQDLANASDEVFWVTDIESGCVLYVSPAYERVWKRSAASLLEDPDTWVEPIHPGDREAAEQAYRAGLAARRAFEVEFRIVLPDGSVRHVLNRGFPVYAGDGALIRMAGVASDITELHRAREELRMLAETDELTGALNSRAFRRLLRHELTRSVRERRPLAVALLDIDNFKVVNDEHGHLAGDAVLTQVVRILCGRLRASDIVARLGGDEFCVVLPNADEDGAARVLEELKCEVARVRVPLHSGQSAAVTLSVGIAISNPASDEGELLKRADDALYVSKRDGRNRVSVAPMRLATLAPV